MKKASILNELTYRDDGPLVSVMLESEFTKEIRIVFKAEQIMKEHQTPHPIVVEIFDGEIDFGVSGTVHRLRKGDLISLKGDVPHDLKALSESIVRLTLSKADRVVRVESITK